MRTYRLRAIVLGLLAAAAAVYLHDPPWAGAVTSGLLAWEEDPPGTRFRWTAARASLFIPSDATAMTLPLRAAFPGRDGRPTRVSVSVDGRWLADVDLPDENAWVRPLLPLPRRTSGRRFRRVDLHVDRTAVGVAILGVMTGEIVLTRDETPLDRH